LGIRWIDPPTPPLPHLLLFSSFVRVVVIVVAAFSASNHSFVAAFASIRIVFILIVLLSCCIKFNIEFLGFNPPFEMNILTKFIIILIFFVFSINLTNLFSSTHFEDFWFPLKSKTQSSKIDSSEDIQIIKTLNSSLLNLRNELQTILYTSKNIKTFTPILDSVTVSSVDLPKLKVKSTINGKKAVIFTMDSLTAYEENSRIGGAAGS
jgi:hypothetical protein